MTAKANGAESWHWTVNWHGGEGGWRDFPLVTVDGCAVARTDTGAEIRVDFEDEADEIAEAAGAIVRLVTVSATPGEDGRFSGVRLEAAIEPAWSCIWKPHLAPLEAMAIGDRAFRSPAIVLQDDGGMLALIPDLETIGGDYRVPHVMDFARDGAGNRMMYGLCRYRETGHVYYELDPTEERIEGTLIFRFRLVYWKGARAGRDLRPVERYLYGRYAAREMTVKRPAPRLADLKPYVDYAYRWAFESWGGVAWQQFDLNGCEVGGVVFIVTAKQKPGMGREEEWREPKSLWNQAWFCGLRSAYGYWLWGREAGRPDWQEKAELNLAFALNAPQQGGLFPVYYQAGEDGRWESGAWGLSPPRRPAGHGRYYHLLDNSWTCYWLLHWYRDIRQDPAILSYVQAYAERLVSLQAENGSFPAWVREGDYAASPVLAESAETGAHVMLLALLNEIAPHPDYVRASEKAGAFLFGHLMPDGRWEDFETYWSCSKVWAHKQPGVAEPRSGLYAQCNFGIYWAAEAFKALYRMTADRRYLDRGETVLAELSLYQQIWQPPFFAVPTVGGFGVMNTDDEWNDARQSLFAVTYLDYYRLTGREDYRVRGLWAMKASFHMMYCPDNPEVGRLYEMVHPHFGEEEYGFHMENFNHHDGSSVHGLGEFTIFDWGNGAAAASLAKLALADETGGLDAVAGPLNTSSPREARSRR